MKLSEASSNKISAQFTKLIQQQIKDKGLIDTGALYNSIETTINYKNGNIEFEIEAEDYFIFLDDEYSITKDAQSSNGFNKVLSLIEEGYVEAIQEQIEK